MSERTLRHNAPVSLRIDAHRRRGGAYARAGALDARTRGRTRVDASLEGSSLTSSCHGFTWSAGDVEREQIREYLAAGVPVEHGQR